MERKKNISISSHYDHHMVGFFNYKQDKRASDERAAKKSKQLRCS